MVSARAKLPDIEVKHLAERAGTLLSHAPSLRMKTGSGQASFARTFSAVPSEQSVDRHVLRAEPVSIAPWELSATMILHSMSSDPDRKWICDL